VDGSRRDAEVRHGRRAGLLRIVDEVSLRPAVGLLTDDLDRALVRADGPVRAEAVEDGAHGVALVERERGVDGEAGLRDVVGDADGEVVARLGAGELVEDGLHHRRVELLRREAVAAGDHHRLRRLRPRLAQRRHHIEPERVADRTGLLIEYLPKFVKPLEDQLSGVRKEVIEKGGDYIRQLVGLAYPYPQLLDKAEGGNQEGYFSQTEK